MVIKLIDKISLTKGASCPKHKTGEISLAAADVHN